MARALNLLAAAIFVAFAWLQIDDGDPEVYVQPSVADVAIWVAFYGLVALLFVMAAVRKFLPMLVLFAAVFAVLLMLRTIPGVIANMQGGGFDMAQHSMSPERSHVELSREFFGALIALVGMGGVWWQARRASPSFR